MAEPIKKEKPIVRYSDLARSSENGLRNIGSDTPVRDTDEIMFRDAIQLRAMGRSQSPQPVASSGAGDHHVARLFEQILHEVTGIYTAARGGLPFRLERVFGLAQAIADHATPDRLLSQLFEAHPQFHYTDLNSAHCAIIAVQIARGLGHQRDEQVQLAVASLVHDIGMQTLPQGLLNTPGPLSKDQVAAVRTHPESGARLLKQAAPQHPWLAAIVREEHEREQGQGYPNGLRSEEIHALAKILGLADIYDALICPRPYRRMFSPHEAVQELLDCQDRLGYPKLVVRELIQQLSLFPAGCRVRLSSNEVGRVILMNKQSPLRPVVEVLFDAEGQPLQTPRHVDLNTNPLVYVTASLPLEHACVTAPSENGN